MKRLAPVSLLILVGCGIQPAEKAEVCAITALPGVPGVDRIGDPKPLAPIDRHLQAFGQYYGTGWRQGGHVKFLGRCAKQAPTVDMVLIQGVHAATKGGLRENGVQKSFGTCFYQKVETRWRLLACRINGAS